MLKEQLEQIGLTDRESKVYLALLELGSTTTSKIIRKTAIESSKIYDVLERLEHKGVVTHIIMNGKKHFKAAKPDKLFYLIKEKEYLIENMLPQLNLLYNKVAEEEDAEIVKGKQGAKNIYEDILNTAKDWDILGGSGKGITTLPYYLPQFYKRLENKKISTRILFVDTEETRIQRQELTKHKNIQIKFLPKKIQNLLILSVYANKLIIVPIIPNIEEMPLAIQITSKTTSQGFKQYFNWLWKISKK